MSRLYHTNKEKEPQLLCASATSTDDAISSDITHISVIRDRQTQTTLMTHDLGYLFIYNKVKECVLSWFGLAEILWTIQ